MTSYGALRGEAADGGRHGVPARVLPAALQLPVDPAEFITADPGALQVLPQDYDEPVSRQIGVRVHLDVCRSPGYGGFVEGVDEAWHRDMPLHGHLPGRGDLLQLWPGGPWWVVRHRRFDGDGIAELDLAVLRIDPDPDALAAMLTWPNSEWGWWAGDEHLSARLASGGWQPTPQYERAAGPRDFGDRRHAPGGGEAPSCSGGATSHNHPKDNPEP